MKTGAALLATEEKANWNAADALLDNREHEAARIWDEFNTHGIQAIEEIMAYLKTIEGQNTRLNRRIEALENQMRFLDRAERLLSHQKI